ncbi:beta-mannosidase [Pseudalkalibacillus sp. JSM 102089]|uniref:beta-mannosidase n=1 Tax=Pseudalkalibacillus sp. JSM 102089 TaxID=3229856 RepID=UPI0035255266
MKLSSEWKLQWFEAGEKNPLELAAPYYIDHFWMTTAVPGDVHSTLIDKKLIKDPFIGHNDLDCRWVEEKEWWYRTSFSWDESLSKSEKLELEFEGLDTFATVYLNGLEIGSTENMFIEHSFDVSRAIKQGKNKLAVRFDPVTEEVEGKERNYWCSYGKERIWARKAAMNFGWDWGPRLVTTGIWKAVHLHKRTKGKFDGVFAKTVKANEEKALVEIKTDIKSFYPFHTENFRIEVELLTADGAEVCFVKSNLTTLHLEIDHPTLWWTHDLGEPYLYELNVKLKDEDGTVVDEHSQQFGIRTVTVEQKHENGENLFVFNLNGVRLFAKGANWIPVHSFIGAARNDRYSNQLELAKDAHMNMMRVWGGGIYEKDIFYEECDRLGLLVWQDFMFANALYPDYNENFMENVRNEVSKVVKRLRKHTCLALWCGNNEIDWIYDRKHSDGEITTPFYGEQIYHSLIPEILKKLDNTRLYWPSSPFGGNDLDAEEMGDRHNWQVWHGNVEPRKKGEAVVQDISLEGVSFKNYKKDYTRFSSEFGMHASSNQFTLKSYIPEGEFYWKSDEMSYRNKDHFHEKGILLMEGYTGIPETIDEYMNYSMLTQAEGLKYGIEHYRRQKPFTAGALIWQLNDCWPGTSWSMIDYELLPKASYYYAKKFFAPVMAVIDHDPGESLKLSVINDRLTSIKDSLNVDVVGFNGEVVFSRSLDFSVESNSVTELAVLSEEEVLNGASASKVIVRAYAATGSFEENRYYLRDYKDMNYPAAVVEIENNEAENTITLSSRELARFVKVDFNQSGVTCSDNFFDLLPGESKTINLCQLNGEAIQFEGISVSSMNSRKTIPIKELQR